MDLEFRFPRAYEAALVGRGAVRRDHLIHFSGVTSIADRKPLIVEVTPYEGSPWTGLFNRNTEYFEAVNGIYSFPDPNVILVVSGGQGYLVDVHDPSDWEAIRFVPVLNIADIPAKELVVFTCRLYRLHERIRVWTEWTSVAVASRFV